MKKFLLLIALSSTAQQTNGLEDFFIPDVYAVALAFNDYRHRCISMLNVVKKPRTPNTQRLISSWVQKKLLNEDLTCNQAVIAKTFPEKFFIQFATSFATALTSAGCKKSGSAEIVSRQLPSIFNPSENDLTSLLIWRWHKEETVSKSDCVQKIDDLSKTKPDVRDINTLKKKTIGWLTISITKEQFVEFRAKTPRFINPVAIQEPSLPTLPTDSNIIDNGEELLQQ